MLLAAAAFVPTACSDDDDDRSENIPQVDPLVGTWEATLWSGIKNENDEPFSYTMEPGERLFVFSPDGALSDISRIDPENPSTFTYRWERSQTDGVVSLTHPDGSFFNSWVVTLSEDNEQLTIFMLIDGFGTSQYECVRQ